MTGCSGPLNAILTVLSSLYYSFRQFGPGRDVNDDEDQQ